MPQSTMWKLARFREGKENNARTKNATAKASVTLPHPALLLPGMNLQVLTLGLLPARWPTLQWLIGHRRAMKTLVPLIFKAASELGWKLKWHPPPLLFPNSQDGSAPANNILPKRLPPSLPAPTM